MLTRLLRDRAGNVALNFALLMVPLFGIAGGAIDYNRVLKARVELQDSADGAVLAAARAIELGETAGGDPETVARAVFAANADLRDARLAALSVTADKARVALDARAEVRMAFLGILGIDTMAVGVHAESLVSATTLEIALTLDNTGSMQGSRLATLKEAARTFVDQLSAGTADPDRIRFAVVPFSAFVNVGPKQRGAAWLDNDGKSSRAGSNFDGAANRFALYDRFGIAWPGCVETRPAPYDVTDTAPDPAKPDTLFVPAFWPDEPDAAAGHWYPNDYLPDRTGGGELARLRHAAKYEAGTIDRSNSTFFSNYKRPKGPDFGCDITAVTPLTGDYGAVKTALAAMKAFGSTDIPEGLAWGWRVLSPEAPFTEGRAYGTGDNQKIIVLMTDGANSLTTFGTAAGGQYSAADYPYHDYLGPRKGTNMRPNLDAKTIELCTNIKARNIEIYTIGLELGTDTAAKDLLSRCATSSGHFYDAAETSELAPIFDKIAQRISRLRLAR